MPVVDNFPGSTLLQVGQQEKLHEWVGVPKSWKLIYKASRDGFLASDFHSMCDGKGENLGVIKSDNGYLFGWWTPISWKSSNAFAIDASTFIFTLTNPAGVPAKYKNKDASCAVYDGSSCGPKLGNCDIHVWNTPTDSHTTFPTCYEDTTGRGPATFTGSGNFQVSDLEVFVPE